MALYDYMGALRLGRKQYQTAVSKGEYPYLPVLDEILSNMDIVSEVNLGLQDIPLERIVGTKTQGRTQAFASNFMPLLGEKTEFGAKWAFLYDHQIEEGIHDPIIAYEFMNRYYVMEGNKRVSVLKYVNAYSVPAMVTRLVPRRSDDLDSRLYYEFLDFYQVSFNSDVWFSKEGCYNQLLELLGKEPGQVWEAEERSYFKAVYDLFAKVFQAKRTEEIEMTASDAFLLYLQFFAYPVVREQTEAQMKRGLDSIWDELLLQANGSQIDLVEQPAAVEQPVSKLLNWLKPSAVVEPEMLKVAFIYTKNRENSCWAYGHELGRIYLEECFDHKMQTLAFENAGTEAEIANAMNLAVAAGCNVIFTTAPLMTAYSVKMAVHHPEIRIFNCSVNESYSSICTYYARMYESKFLLGALAAAVSDSDDLGYIADYPIYGMVANINAFALGAKMINPRVKVHLKWAGTPNHTCRKDLEREGITYIAGDDMITPDRGTREFGLYHKLADGTVENIGTSLCDWGKFYEKLIRMICHGAIDLKSQKGRRALNYWWGMSADVIDVVYSENIPIGTKRLIRFLKGAVQKGAFHVFVGPIYAQNGRVIAANKNACGLTPQEIVNMDWLVENVVGEIPPIEAFEREMQPVIRMQTEKAIQTEKQMQAEHQIQEEPANNSTAGGMTGENTGVSGS